MAGRVRLKQTFYVKKLVLYNDEIKTVMNIVKILYMPNE